MIERVATAIGRVLATDSAGRCLLCSTREQDMEIARAAMEAMREPTLEMERVLLVAGGLAAEDVWPAMIAEALK